MANEEPVPGIDPNKIVAEFISANFGKIYERTQGLVVGGHQRVKVRLRRTYKTYLDNSLRTYSKTKSFFSRTEAVGFYSVYIESTIKKPSGAKLKMSAETVGTLAGGTVLSGSAGSGKSMCMKHLLIDSVVRSSRIPVLVELRRLNNTGLSLEELIIQTLQRAGLDLDEDYIIHALELLDFLVLLDGYDEVQPSLRESVAKQIQEIQSDFPVAKFVVSSRPDTEFSSWTNFTTVELMPLSRENAVLLVSRLPYDPEIKERFLEDLSSRLYEHHTTFLSNPLLLTIMLLAYSQSVDIPGKLSLFYNQAFEALFERHDAYKGAFRRERRCNLDISDFEKVFSAFCLQTYDDRKFQFSRQEALEYIDHCVAITGIEVHAPSFLEDCLQSTTLLLEDGLWLVFAHRSFQEYFVAKFISGAPREVQGELVSSLAVPSIRQDNVLDLLFEIDKSLVEQHFVIPHLRDVSDQVGFKKELGVTHYLKFLKCIHGTIRIINYNVESVRILPAWDVVGFAMKHYEFDVGRYALAKQKTKEILFRHYGEAAKGQLTVELKEWKIQTPIVRELFSLKKKSIFYSFAPRLVEFLLRLPGKLEAEQSRSRASILEILKGGASGRRT